MSITSRTTVAAASDDLDTLRSEARRRGVPLSAVLSEAVSDKAASLRVRKPRTGVARSRDGKAAADVAVEPPPFGERRH